MKFLDWGTNNNFLHLFCELESLDVGYKGKVQLRIRMSSIESCVINLNDDDYIRFIEIRMISGGKIIINHNEDRSFKSKWEHFACLIRNISN